MADVKEILVHWDVGEAISQIARSLGYSRPPVRKYLRATPPACLARARALGPATGALVHALLEPHALHHLREVQALLRLADRFGAERLERAGGRALEAGDGR